MKLQSWQGFKEKVVALQEENAQLRKDNDAHKQA